MRENISFSRILRSEKEDIIVWLSDSFSIVHRYLVENKDLARGPSGIALHVFSYRFRETLAGY